MNRRFFSFQQMLFAILDLFILNLIYLFTQSMIEGEVAGNHIFYWLLFNVGWILITWIGDTYATNRLVTFERFAKTTYRIYFVWVFLVLVASYLLKNYFSLSRPFVYRSVLYFAVGLFINRVLYLFIRIWVRERLYLNRRIMILGYNTLAKKITRYLERDEFNIQIIGYIEDSRRINELSNYPVFSEISNTMEIAKRMRINEIYSTIMPENNSQVYQLMQEADKELIRFKFVPDFAYFINRPIHVDYFYDLPVLSVRKEPLEEVMNQFKKRMFDITVSLFVTLFIMTWLVPLLGLLIYLESPGPIFFVQLRSGKNNRPFRCLKFRSMTSGNKEANLKQATKNDARVTRIGRILRKSSLDEFPQFLNVLVGDMSIVGPRPHMLKHTKDFAIQEDQYMIRQFLKPGITGWAQVNGYRGEIRELEHIQKRVEYDLWYLENWSLWLDLKIMFLTVYNVFKGEENAY